MRSKYFDTIIILSQVIILLFSSYKLFFESTKTSNNLGTQLAYLEQKSATVKKRANGLLNWVDISSKEPIFNGDRIFTHSNSYAIIRFSDSSKIVLNENALVKIEKNDEEQLNIDIKKGGVVVEGSANMMLTVGDVSISSSSSESKISIQSDGKSSKISLLSGKATLKSKSGSQKIDENSAIDLNEKGQVTQIQQMSISLLSPSAGETSYVDQKTPVKLRWKFLKKKKNQGIKIAVSSDSDFEKNVKFIKTKKESLALDKLLPGSYYWKATDMKGVDISAVDTFNVVKMTAPTLLSPANNHHFRIKQVRDKKAETSLSLKWEGQTIDLFRIELQSLSGNKSEYQTSDKSLILESMPLGEYTIRIGSIFEKKVKWSPFQKFNISINPLPKAPRINSPKGESTHVGRTIKLLFEERDEITYQLVINHDEQVIINEDLDQPRYQFKAPHYGKFCLLLSVIDQLERHSDNTPKRCITLIPAPPKISSLPSSFFYSDDFESIDIKWRHSDDLQFQLQIATDAKFKNILTDKLLDDTSFSWKKPKPGRYYIRIRSVSDKAKGSFSLPIRTRVKELPKLEAPVLVPGKTFELGHSQHQNWWDFIINQAHADEFKTTIKWPLIKMAKKYQLEIFENANSKKPIISITTEKPFYHWSNATPGAYYWRLSYIDQFGRKSPTSKLVPMRIEASKKWIRAQKELHPNKWQLKAFLNPSSLSYNLTSYIDFINITGGSLTSLFGSAQYKISNNFFIQNSNSFFTGPIFDANLMMIRSRLYGGYTIKFKNSIQISPIIGGRMLYISHSSPIDKVSLAEVAGIKLQFGKKIKHLITIEMGISLFSGDYQMIVPLNKKLFGVLGINYYSENLSYDFNTVEISSLGFMIGGGVQF